MSHIVISRTYYTLLRLIERQNAISNTRKTVWTRLDAGITNSNGVEALRTKAKTERATIRFMIIIILLYTNTHATKVKTIPAPWSLRVLRDCIIKIEQY